MTTTLSGPLVTGQYFLRKILQSTVPDFWINDHVAVYSFNRDGDITTWKVEWNYKLGKDHSVIMSIRELTNE